MKRKLLFVAAVVASALGFNANAQTEAPTEPTLKTSPLAEDGETIQYLYNVEANAFLLGANDWNTQASVAPKKGWQIKAKKNGESWQLGCFAEAGGKANQWQGLFVTDARTIFVDNAGEASAKTWVITPVEGADNQFKISNTHEWADAGYLAVVPSKNDTRLYFSQEEEAQDVWVAVNADDYESYFKALDEYRKATYKVGDDIVEFAPVSWEGQDRNGTAVSAAGLPEHYQTTPMAAGEVLTQTLTGLKNGIYTVTLKVAASYADNPDAQKCETGPGLSVGFVQDKTQEIEVKQRKAVSVDECDVVTLTVKVTDGTLKYGIKNIKASGNWYVATVASIVFDAEAITTQYGVEYALIGENLIKNGSFDEGLTDWKAANYDTDADAANFTIVDEGGFDGGKYIITNGEGKASPKSIRQSVAVEPGKKYLFTVYTSGQAPDAANIQYNGLYAMTDSKTEVEDVAPIVDFGWPQGASKTTEAWSKTEYVFTAAEGNPNVGVRLSWNKNSHFDGFSLYEVELLSSAVTRTTPTSIGLSLSIFHLTL